MVDSLKEQIARWFYVESHKPASDADCNPDWNALAEMPKRGYLLKAGKLIEDLGLVQLDEDQTPPIKVGKES